MSTDSITKDGSCASSRSDTDKVSSPSALDGASASMPDLEHGARGLAPLARRPWCRHVAAPAEILDEEYEGAGTEARPYIVTWLGDDAENPLNWSASYKAVITALVSFPTFAVTFASSAYVGAIPPLMMRFPGYAVEVYVAGISTFVLGFAVGPLLFAPASEVFGRRNLAIVTLAVFVLFTVGLCVVENMWAIIALRFIAGAAGSNPLTNSGGAIGDIYDIEKRGVAMGIFAMAPIMAPTLGPVVSGFLGASAGGFRWVFGLIAVVGGLCWLADALWQPETYAPVLLRRRAARLSRATGKVYRSVYERERKVELRALLKTSFIRPWALLFREPIVLLLSAYLAVIYGTLYLLFAAFPIIYAQERGWSDGVAGLAFLGVLIGFLCGAAWMTLVENPRYIRINRAHDGFAPPETRLVPTMIGGAILPIGLFVFAWTAMPERIHWAVSLAAIIPFGFGLVLVFLSILIYLVDAYLIFAASALAANTIIRSLLGAAFPLVATRMYARLGTNWASTLVACLALACAPIPFAFYRWGPPLRRRCVYGRRAAEVQDEIRAEAVKAQERVERRKTMLVMQAQQALTAAAEGRLTGQRSAATLLGTERMGDKIRGSSTSLVTSMRSDEKDVETEKGLAVVEAGLARATSDSARRVSMITFAPIKERKTADEVVTMVVEVSSPQSCTPSDYEPATAVILTPATRIDDTRLVVDKPSSTGDSRSSIEPETEAESTTGRRKLESDGNSIAALAARASTFLDGEVREAEAAEDEEEGASAGADAQSITSSRRRRSGDSTTHMAARASVLLEAGFFEQGPRQTRSVHSKCFVSCNEPCPFQ